MQERLFEWMHERYEKQNPNMNASLMMINL